MRAVNKIVFNTGVLYIKLFVSLFLGLFTTRFVLQALGETDYGIYSLVAGVVGMLAILQSAMSNTSMRYMAHSLGSKDQDLICRTFNTTLVLHFGIAILVLFIIEIGGYFMFRLALDIPAERISDAKIVFHLMAVTSFVAIIAVPYDAVMNAHENLLALSLVDILGTALNLIVAICLLTKGENKLVIYGVAMFCIQLLKRLVKQVYAVRTYSEAKLNFHNTYDRVLVKEIMSFTGWNLLGSLAAMSVNQLRSLLLNMFFGVTINASEGIARTANGKVNMLSSNLSRAINPQLVKSEGGGNRVRMIKMIFFSTKFTSFILLLLAVPLYVELPYLFDLWLDKVPENAVLFGRFLLIGLFLEKLTVGITTSINAVGKIKAYLISGSIIMLMNIPISYVLFRCDFPALSIYIVAILLSFVNAVNRFYFGKKLVGINPWKFIKVTTIPLVVLLFVAFSVSLSIREFMDEGLLRLIVIVVLNLILSSILLIKIVLSKEEVQLLKNFINPLIKTFFLKNRRYYE